MRKLLSIIIFFVFYSFLLLPVNIQAIYDPFSVPNNRFGVHILDTQEVADAAKLVNSSGGDWGYVTIPIRSDDRNREKWFNFFTDCRRLHLIPIIRLATFVDGDKWVAPTSFDLVDYANFLDSLPWPTSNRYVILFNEINHSKEWGGRVSPLEYATLLIDAQRIFKDRSDDYYLLTAGLDMSAPNNDTSMDALKFYREMTRLQPDWYEYVDGISVHAYPNPGFSSSVFSTSRFGVSSYTHEENLLKNFEFTGKPIFITETGYIGRDDFYTPAFTQIWTEQNIAAITPFILFAGAGDFTKFSLLDLSRQPGASYRTIENLPKVAGSPLLNPNLPPLVDPVATVSPPEVQPSHKPSVASTQTSENLNLWQKFLRLIRPKNLTTLKIGFKKLTVEIANTPASRARGLSYRDSLPRNEGMLFIMESREPTNFWMNEMRIPLDIIWIDQNQVVGLTENIPPPSQTNNQPVTVNSGRPVDWVIEVNAGFIRDNDIKVGDQVEKVLN